MLKCVRIFTCAYLLLWGLSSGVVSAHESRPLFIGISEAANKTVRVVWKVPPSLKAEQISQLTLSAPCKSEQSGLIGGRRQGVLHYTCPYGISGIDISVIYRLYNPSISTLIRVEYLGGQRQHIVLEPSKKMWTIPEKVTSIAVTKTYFTLGVRHIAGGIDHLLFLVLLLYIARTFRRIVGVVSCFTAAHTVTIFLTALNIVRVSIPAVESVIALSLVFLAVEIKRNNRETLTWRYPMLVASGFGLFHGMGFASALSEYGLPQSDKILALLFFNIGVEFGQLVAVAMFFGGLKILRYSANQWPFSAEIKFMGRVCFLYGLGGVASYWLVEQLAVVL